MEVDEKVELRCLRPKWGEPVSILCYHQGWDNRNDYIVCGIFPVEFVSVVNEFQIFSNQKIFFTLHASQVISNAEDNFDPSTLSLLEWGMNIRCFKQKYIKKQIWLTGRRSDPHIWYNRTDILQKKVDVCAIQDLCPKLVQRFYGEMKPWDPGN